MKENSHIGITVSSSWTSSEFQPEIQRPTSEQNATRAELQQLKARLLRPVLEKTSEPELCHQLCLAANEALAEAWSKPCPFLLLSCLWEEKVREVRCWFKRQQQIFSRTQPLLEQCESAETAMGLSRR